MAYYLRQNPSPMHWDGRYGRSIDKILIHHAATTDFDGIGRTFNGNREVSAHYGVGRNQNVDQYVQESDAAWHAGNGEVNLTSIGIEHVNSTGAPDWGIDEATFNTSVELCRDIATRNRLLPLVVGKNLFGHKDFYNTACPGNLYPRLQELADRVNSGTSSAPAPAPAHNSKDQILEVGSNIQFGKYRVDALAFVGGTWQIFTNALCPIDFNWDDNGVPAAPVTETSDPDQILAIGSTYVIQGTYKVLNLGIYKGIWFAQVNVGGWSFWVDTTTLTEV